MTVLPLVSKRIRESVIKKTRELQYFNFVASLVIINADYITSGHNLALANLKKTSDWQTARIIITSAQFITKMKPFATILSSIEVVK